MENGTYRRSIAFNGNAGWFEAALDDAAHALTVRLRFPDPQCLFFVIERIRTMFDLDADWLAIDPVLRADALLAHRVDAAPGLRVPGCWDGIELTVRVMGGRALTARLVREFGKVSSSGPGLTHFFPTPAALANVPASNIRRFARAVHDQEITFDRAAASDALLTRLHEVSGIGRRASQYIAMRALGEPVRFPLPIRHWKRAPRRGGRGGRTRRCIFGTAILTIEIRQLRNRAGAVSASRCPTATLFLASERASWITGVVLDVAGGAILQH